MAWESAGKEGGREGEQGAALRTGLDCSNFRICFYPGCYAAEKGQQEAGWGRGR